MNFRRYMGAAYTALLLSGCGDATTDENPCDNKPATLQSDQDYEKLIFPVIAQTQHTTATCIAEVFKIDLAENTGYLSQAGNLEPPVGTVAVCGKTKELDWVLGCAYHEKLLPESLTVCQAVVQSISNTYLPKLEIGVSGQHSVMLLCITDSKLTCSFGVAYKNGLDASSQDNPVFVPPVLTLKDRPMVQGLCEENGNDPQVVWETINASKKTAMEKPKLISGLDPAEFKIIPVNHL